MAATVFGAVQNGLVAGIDDRVIFGRLKDLAASLEGGRLDDVVGRATLENVARFILYRMADLPIQRVRIDIEAAWAEVSADDLTEDYLGILAFDRAVSLLLRDRADQALVAFDEAVKLFPSARAHNARGRCLRRLGRHSEAIGSYDLAIAMDPCCGEAYRNRGNALLESGELSRALDSFDEAVRLLPVSALAINNRGFGRAALGHHELALVDHTRAIELDPGYEEAYRDRAQALNKLGRSEEAQADFGRANALAGKQDELMLNRLKLTLSGY